MVRSDDTHCTVCCLMQKHSGNVFKTFDVESHSTYIKDEWREPLAASFHEELSESELLGEV